MTDKSSPYECGLTAELILQSRFLDDRSAFRLIVSRNNGPAAGEAINCLDSANSL